MQLNITARHIDLTPALSAYVQKKVEKAQRYFDSIIWAQAILTVEKHRHIAELVVHTPGSTFRTVGESGDLYAAIDLAVHKLDLHLSRIKDKKKNKHRNGARRGARQTAEELAALAIQAELAVRTPLGESPSVEVNPVALKTLPVSQAIKEFHAFGRPALLFVNSKTDRISVLYRRGRKGYAILEAEES